MKPFVFAFLATILLLVIVKVYPVAYAAWVHATRIIEPVIFAFSAWAYDSTWDENTWSLRIGIGRRRHGIEEGEIGGRYRYMLGFDWRPLRPCLIWWSDGYYHERDRTGVSRVITLLRVIGIYRSPISIRLYREAPRNVYDGHPLMISSGEFWRCDHGWTGYAEGFEWLGCPMCAIWRPGRAFRFMLAQLRIDREGW